VLLIDASEQYAKLRKNLGAKNCELTLDHINDIQEAFTNFTDLEGAPDAPSTLRAKLFDTDDFGYCKVSIERPERLKTQFTPERIAELRFDKQLREPMAHAWEAYGDRIYTELKTIGPELLKWCEKNDLDLSTKNRKKLTDPKTWAANRDLLNVAQMLLAEFGEATYLDFNEVDRRTTTFLKGRKIKLSATEKKAILGAVTEYDAAAEKVVKKEVKLTADKLATLLDHLDCSDADLPLYGYYPLKGRSPSKSAASKNEVSKSAASIYRTYETSSNLRDTESVPLKENVQDYFLREVIPHVPEAWIDLDKTKVGFEISFNKYFYRHQPLRTLEEVTADIITLEKENDGLIAEILKLV
jgi:type I restriction enzyme M protein